MLSYRHPFAAYNFFALNFLLQVLMQTRTEKTRVRILGLRIVKYLVDNLKEEYLVLDETIPILGELLEDVELSVKSLAQEILQEMESLSGKSL
jgi:U3 small nucleolar RNA-associated protein 10